MRVETLLIWLGLAVVCAAVFVPYAVQFYRRNRRDGSRRAEAVHLGSDRPVAQYPLIDEGQCIGCGACVAACPEGDVLGILNGRAVIINGLRCIGHARCADACPVGAIRVGLGEVGARDDIPRLTAENETSVPGVYIAGELSGFALIRNAILQGGRVVEAIAHKLRLAPVATPQADGAAPAEGGPLRDLVIVGAGPAGLSAALTARREGLSYIVLEQEETGGTILQYPRKKIVLTQPVEIPLYGWLNRTEYSKEELLGVWQEARTQFELHIRTGVKVEGLDRRPDGLFDVRTQAHRWTARAVVLALGRRGTPRKLGVPGEALPKVCYKLLDAESYRGERLLVVGGGDSAIEAALGLARQPGNTVTLSYRKEKLFRIKRRNEERFNEALSQGTVQVMFSSEVTEIRQDHVRLRQNGGEMELPNDYVFIFAGGDAPFPLLKGMGIGFGGGDAPGN
jgi:thioredoxin reductase/NAD-dependent dihydropyrimidine dehydrogenase PreA subunit